jgi:hypothetical protein
MAKDDDPVMTGDDGLTMTQHGGPSIADIL